MSVALAYGGALLLSGWLISTGVARDHERRSLLRLGYEFPRSRRESRRPILVRGVRGPVQLGALGLLCGLAVQALVGPLGLVVGPGAAALVLRVREDRRRQARRDLLDRQLGDAVIATASAVRAGLSVRQAVAEAAEGSDPPLREELESIVLRLRTGEPLDAALARLDRRLGLSDSRLLVDALTIHGRTGGDLPSLLEEIARVINLRLEDRRSVRLLTAQARTSGAVLAVLPIGFVALLSGTGGDGLGAFYETSAGVAILAVALSLQALGFAWMKRIVRRVEAA